MSQLPKFAALALVLFAGTAGRAAITENLAGLYKFEGDFLDAIGSPQSTHGTPVNGPQFTAGKIGQAMWLPGVRDYMSLNAAASSELDFGSPSSGDAVDFSMAMWIRQDDFLSDPAVLSNKNWNNGANTGVNWAVNGNGIFDLNTKADSGPRRDLDTAANSGQLAVGAWNLVVMTVDRDGPTRLYLNGVNTGAIPATSPGDFNGALPWNVGQDGTGNYGVEFTGAVDELAIWRRALSPAEASQLWNGGAGVDLRAEAVEPVLKLVIDRDFGSMTIENNTGAAQALVGYEIDSLAGALDPSRWSRITGRLDAAGDRTIDGDDNWVVLSHVNSATDFSEGSLGAGVIAAGAKVELGAGAWAKHFEESGDVSFYYANPTDDEPTRGLVEFTGNGGVAFDFLDLNYDGGVDLSDYSAFLARYSTTLSGQSFAQRHADGDLDGDGRHTVHDFVAFKERFDALRGSGAFAALLAGGSRVPEPAAISLGTAASAAGLLGGRRRWRRAGKSRRRSLRGRETSRPQL